MNMIDANLDVYGGASMREFTLIRRYLRLDRQEQSFCMN